MTSTVHSLDVPPVGRYQYTLQSQNGIPGIRMDRTCGGECLVGITTVVVEAH